MPTVRFAPGVISNVAFVYGSIDEATLQADITNFSATRIDLALGTNSYVVHGTGITYGFAGGFPVLTGGTLTGLEALQDGVLQATITDLSMSAAGLQAAILSEWDGTNTAAIEHLFYPLGWTYYGNAGVDTLLANMQSSDGVPFNLSGNDRFYTAGGNDHIFLGDGADLMDGGRGRDTLEGGRGNDTLLGGVGADLLIGGSGADALNGGSEADRLNGGLGNDTMNGGAGFDTFVFQAHSGRDRIVFLNVAEDKIDLAPGVAHSFVDAGTNTELHYGTGTDMILLIGIDLTEAAMITFI